MGAVKLTAKGQVVIPAEIRARYELTPGTQVEFVDDGEAIRLVVRRRVPGTDPTAGYGLIKVRPPRRGRKRRLSDFDAAVVLARSRRSR
jgi:AbrB family looped-hinge helix DNA binding protein